MECKFAGIMPLFVVILCLLCGMPAYGAESVSGQDPIRIGVYQPLTGKYALAGQMEVSGIKLAHAERPTLLGRPVDLVILDNKFDQVEAASAVKLLITEHQVAAIIGSYGSAMSLAGGEVSERARIPVVATSPTSQLVTQGRKFYFRTGFIDPAQGTTAGEFAAGSGLRRAAILVDGKSDYGVGLATFFRRAFIKAGGEIVAEVRYDAGEENFAPALTQFTAKHADVVYMPVFYAAGVAILKEAHTLGASYMMLGADAMDMPGLESDVGQGVKQFRCTSFPFLQESQSSQSVAFMTAWKRTYPDVRPCTLGALGYTAYMMLHDAFVRAGETDGEAVATALSHTQGLNTLFGPLTMTQTRDTNMRVGILDYSSGERKLARTYP